MANFGQKITEKDHDILRNVATKQIEIAKSPAMQQLISDWKNHNSFKGNTPMIHIELGTFAHEIIPDRLNCEGEFARNIEWQLYSNFTNFELFGDDKPVDDYFSVGYNTFFTLFGHNITTEHAINTTGSDLGHRFNYVINDLHDDFDKLGKTQFGYASSKQETHEYMELLDGIFGDILPIKLSMGGLYAVPTQNIVHLMGMEPMLYAMCDYPDEFKLMMNRIADDYVQYFDWLASEQLILPTVDGESLGQGTFCYTDELPDSSMLAKRPFTSKDVWGFMDSQETVSISPEMFFEFMFPCYEKIANRFGLLSYGCCEPINTIWDNCLSKFKHLRKVSISPWCDEEFIGERLRGRKTMFHRKPFPNYIGVGTELDEDAVIKHITKTLNAAKGCTLEITQRDVYTVNHNIAKVRRYVELIRECISKEWQP